MNEIDSQPIDLRFDRVAAIYDGLAHTFSGGAIGRAKRAMAEFVCAQDRVVVGGCGTGEELPALAARNPTTLLAVDLSPRMIQRARRRTPVAQCAVADLIQVLRPASIDVLCLPFVLNLRAIDDARSWLGQAADALAPGGRVVVADFASPVAGIRGIAQEFHWQIPASVCRAIAGGRLHRRHDIEALLSTHPWQVESHRPIQTCGVPTFATWCARRTDH